MTNKEDRFLEEAVGRAHHRIAGEPSKKEVLESLWLNYYNDTLFAAGLISETQRNQMKVKISQRTGR
jgi:hypothetical protein